MIFMTIPFNIANKNVPISPKFIYPYAYNPGGRPRFLEFLVIKFPINADSAVSGLPGHIPLGIGAKLY